ncbi:acetylornithine aminotransferase [Leucobacter sp. CSA1]|uniref:Acetylornithine aminotransferase n=1 Tax=Leucobacter chromiisoli TaxID=2796471 RepID=A0A934Q9H1_9MICO|nr:PrpF domain-containing protein [Leucobacter chromiisoli]MBK0419611.1 acetylornithine aminotransferase [Leucobacter chromiisoli]
MSAQSATAATRWIDAAFVRGGTSKGLFFAERALPPPGEQRDALFAGALGSPDPFGRQLDGMGGGISSLSKVMVVGEAGAAHAPADLVYTFGQVAVGVAAVDYSGNCGNLSAGVVPFALHTGLLSLPDGPRTVRLLNTNTGKRVVVNLVVEDGEAAVAGDFVVPGVAGAGSPIELVYPDPAGSRTAGQLPTGRPIDVLRSTGREIEASLVDVALPLVVVRAADLGLSGAESPDEIDAASGRAVELEALRREAAVLMGLARSPEETPQAVPKVVCVAEPRDSRLLDGSLVAADDADVLARTMSMGLAHRAVPGTAAMCLAAAAAIPGTLVEAIVRDRRPSERALRIGTPSGVVTAGAVAERQAAETGNGEVRDGVPVVTGASLFRTARVLMSGRVSVPKRPADDRP